MTGTTHGKNYPAKEQIYRSYKMQNGKIVHLTEEQFLLVCVYFRKLENTERKRNSQPLLEQAK
jgi:hypothetical protein